MSGALLNAGDFLIEKRSKELIHRFLPEYEIDTLNRVHEDYTDRIDLLNQYDAIIFAGGPLYQHGIYPKAIPFVKLSELGKVKCPIFFVGGGIKSGVFDGSLTSDSLEFFKMGTNSDVPLGCRDILSYRFLKHQGFSNVIVTGCPAWYHPENLMATDFRHFKGRIRKICISEPANVENVSILRELILFLHKRYKEAEVTLVNHREQKKEVLQLVSEFSNRLNYGFVDISGSAEGFKVYNDCDMHIGFRVHAHIYNLSMRNFSVLINEDLRGKGVNDTLGLESIEIERPSYREKKIMGNFYLTQYRNSCSNIGRAVINHVDDFIEMTQAMEYRNYTGAFKRMCEYYQNMCAHFEMIAAKLEAKN